jgi:hypothetical protein
LDLNAEIEKIDKLPRSTKRERDAVARSLRVLWKRASERDGEGEFEKILKRSYRLAGLVASPMFARRAIRDVLRYPALARRIFDYMRQVRTPAAFLQFAESVIGDEEQVYEDVNLALFESLLRLEVVGADARAVRALAVGVLSGDRQLVGGELVAAVAPLLILRFGDRRSLPTLRRCFEQRGTLPEPAVRGAAVVFASSGVREFRLVRRAAARLSDNRLAGIVLLGERIRDYSKVPGSYLQRLKPEFDAVSGRAFIDMRSLVMARLLLLNDRPGIKKEVEVKRGWWETKGISEFDVALTRRLLG